MVQQLRGALGSIGLRKAIHQVGQERRERKTLRAENGAFGSKATRGNPSKTMMGKADPDASASAKESQVKE